MRTLSILLPASLLAVAAVTSPAAQTSDLLLVACAPGYPGSTEQAQPTMDRFADLLAAAAGLPPERIAGEYHEEEETGVARIREVATVAVVPLPFFLKYEHELELHPVVQTVPLSGEASERWSLVAATGRVPGPDALEGWEVIGVPGYAPAFVRGTALGSWGPLPISTEVVFSTAVLGALRRAAAGENVAVLLDGEQTEALPSLPMAGQLEVVARSQPQIQAIVAGVGTRLDADHFAALAKGLLDVHLQEAFGEVLTTLRLSRFAELDAESLRRAREHYRTAG